MEKKGSEGLAEGFMKEISRTLSGEGMDSQKH